MAVNWGLYSVFSDRALDGVIMIVVMMMLAMMITRMMIMSKCLVILAHHERYISTVNCDFQSVFSDRAVDKNAVLPGTPSVSPTLLLGQSAIWICHSSNAKCCR